MLTKEQIARRGLYGNYERKEDGGESNSGPEAKQLLGQLMTAHEEFKAKVATELDEIKSKGSADVVTADEVKRLDGVISGLTKQIEDVRLREARPSIEEGKAQRTELEAKYAGAIADYLRKGDDTALRGAEFKTLSAGSSPDGGYTVLPEMDRAISRVVTQISPIRAIANVRQVGTNQYEHVVSLGGATGGWVSETGSRSTTNTPTLRKRTIEVNELYAMPLATQTMLDDSYLNVEQWIADEAQITFAQKEGTAFVSGTGSGEPHGLVSGYTPVANSGFTEDDDAPGYTVTGASGAFLTTASGDPVANLVDLIHSLKVEYRPNARFLMSDLTLSVVRKFRDGEGQFFWQPSITEGTPSSLLGFPVTVAQDMPTIAADSFSVGFGDFGQAYQVVERTGTRVLRDPYCSKPYVGFYTTRRVGGAVKKFEAYKLLKFGTS